jgi:CheY-like chemotaxis protein
MPTGVRAIVLLTPTDRGALDRLRARGVDGYLTRPVRQASLLAVLAHSDATDAAFAPDPRDRPHDAAVIAPPRTARAIDVLIVDDNPINALLARALVTRLGHRAHVVGDGMAALIAVKRGPQPGTDQAASARRDGRDRECDPGGEPTLEATARTTASGSNNADPLGLSAAPVDKSSVPGKTTATAGEGSGGPFARRYAAVLTDLHMPGRDGFELIRAIRADEARHGLAPARLIAVTADARPDVAVAVRAAGGDATLTKPFEPNHLAELLTFAAPGDPARPS